MWILIRWHCQKPADVDLQCFQKRINLGSAGQGLIGRAILLLLFMNIEIIGITAVYKSSRQHLHSDSAAKDSDLVKRFDCFSVMMQYKLISIHASFKQFLCYWAKIWRQ